MKFGILSILFIFLIISCTEKEKVKTQFNKQEQLYQAEKAFKELDKEK